MLRTFGIVTLLGVAVAAHALTPDASLDFDQTARQINHSGFICSEITSVNRGMAETMWNVRCVQFHDGTGEAHFSIDTKSGVVMQTY